jgi:hypothetical protein
MKKRSNIDCLNVNIPAGYRQYILKTNHEFLESNILRIVSIYKEINKKIYIVEPLTPNVVESHFIYPFVNM